MNKALRVILGVIIVVLSAINGISSVKIDLKPANFTEGEKVKDAVVSCRLDNQESDYLESVDVIRVARKGNRTIVALYSNNTIAFLAGNEDEYGARGSVDGADSELDLTIKGPDKEDAGTYSCVVTFTDKLGKTVTHKAPAVFNVIDRGVKALDDTVKKLEEKVKKKQEKTEKMEKKEKEKDKKVGDIEKKHKKQTDKLKEVEEKEKAVEDKVQKLEADTDKQLKEVELEAEKEDKEIDKLKSVMKTLEDKVKQEKLDIKNIESKARRDRDKARQLDQEDKQRLQQLKALEAREKLEEKKVEDLEALTQNQFKKLQSIKNKGQKASSLKQELESKSLGDENRLMEIKERHLEVSEKLKELEVKADNYLKTLHDKGADQSGANIIMGGAKPSPAISFSAANLGSRTDSSLIFPDIVSQVGRGYDSSTGVFTAPMRGLYVFSLLVRLECIACYANLKVMAGSKVLFRLKVGNKFDGQQGSATSPAHLERGDKVKVSVGHMDSSNGADGSWRMNIFSGYLINAG